jgi:GxxExxY protein
MREGARDLEESARIVVDTAYKLYAELGPGLLESVYETVLARALARVGLSVERQKPVSFQFDGLDFNDAFRLDLLIDDQLIVEIKSVEMLNKAHGKQLLTYLRLTGRTLGLLLNFGAPTFGDGVKRIVNGHSNFASSRLRVHHSDGSVA